MNGLEGKALPYGKIPTDKFEKSDKNRKSPFDEHYHLIISSKNHDCILQLACRTTIETVIFTKY